MKSKGEKIMWAILRISMGWMFLWTFLDKTFGLGFATKPEESWAVGKSPTYGFLKFGTSGPFSDFYQGLAGNATVDWLFMMGMLIIGLCLILGIGTRIASIFGIIMFVLIDSAYLPHEHNPVIDDHIIYILILAMFIIVSSGQYLGFGKKWEETNLVKKLKFLK